MNAEIAFGAALILAAILQLQFQPPTVPKDLFSHLAPPLLCTGVDVGIPCEVLSSEPSAAARLD